MRSADHVRRAALAGADVATMPPKVMWQLASHPLTEKGVALFKADWAKSAPASGDVERQLRVMGVTGRCG